MSMFRSEDMSYCRMVLPRESAWETMNELGKIECLHLIDQDQNVPNISRPFYNNIKRCDELEFMLREITIEIHKNDGIIQKCSNFNELVSVTFQKVLGSRQSAGRTYFDEIEKEIRDRHKALIDQVQNLEQIMEKQKNLEEYKQVLIKAQEILGPAFFASGQSEGREGIDIHGMSAEEIKSEPASGLNKICGVIDSVDSNRFQKVVFRITKGNCWIAVRDVPELNQSEGVSRSVFVIVFPGNRNGAIFQKVSRMCESFSASRFQLPASQQEHALKIKEIQTQIVDSRQVINLTRKNLMDFLTEFTNEKYNAGFSYIEFLKHYVAKERSIYTSMNHLKPSGSVYVGFCWIPSDLVQPALSAVEDLAHAYPNLPSSSIRVIEADGAEPPTYFKTNEFKAMFQLIVDTYGVPTYKEVNPGLFVIVGFPFLFGVMFGDIGHGSILFLFGLYLLIFKDSILADKTSMLRGVIPARYLVTFMGFFALYCGLIYNDFLSISMDFFGSCYPVNNVDITVYPKKDCVYPFGIDPVWGRASNNLTSVNSFKMKLAVIIGVSQMCLGICMKAFNAVYFKKWVDFFFEFLPQILFMGLMFGYMDMLIFVKWATNYVNPDTHALDTQIPAIITTLIDMALKLGGVSDTNGPIIGSNQSSVQSIILVIVIICVPLMLIPKPFILRYQNNKKKAQEQIVDSEASQRLMLGHDEDDLAKDLENAQERDSAHPKAGGHSEEFSEIFVHQIIETIEFVLGSISNTASYLRLWALSLAHSQLAEVFFQKGIQSGLESGSVPMLVIGFFVFALVTCGVLLAMDVMECFLHALRLQWVEFQNKFYKALGYAFAPLSFVKSIEAAILPAELEQEAKMKKAK